MKMHGGLSPPTSSTPSHPGPCRFFSSNLHAAIPQVNHPSSAAIMSDRDKGLVQLTVIYRLSPVLFVSSICPATCKKTVVSVHGEYSILPSVLLL